MAQKGNYIFTNKVHPIQGVMSVILACIAIASIVMAIYITFSHRGEALNSSSVAVLFAMIIAIVGFVLAIIAQKKTDIFRLTAYLGVFLNGLALVGVGMIIYAGVYGL
ncbi:MAG: DUF6142 family protein [Eubacteriales bacterium]